jgi:hypothetical protein
MKGSPITICCVQFRLIAGTATMNHTSRTELVLHIVFARKILMMRFYLCSSNAAVFLPA